MRRLQADAHQRSVNARPRANSVRRPLQLRTAPRPPGPSERETVAFVFQGGGSLTATQVGHLRALGEAGIRPDFVIGTSAGALNTVMFATDPTPAGLNRLEAVWTSPRRRMVPLSAATLARAVTGRAPSVVSDRGLRDLHRANLTARLEDTVLPVLVVATDQLTGNAVVLRDGSVVDSLLASTRSTSATPIG